ncbi:MAG: hypothetical protein C0468_07005 [Planctomyces sp.]|nr:hypothetical protein [Planctomyces sp.]MBA4120830.1 hypothetical protein [Isosphaera sp.]
MLLRPGSPKRLLASAPRLRHRAAAALLLAASLGPWACQAPPPFAVGQSGLRAQYVLGTLFVTFPLVSPDQRTTAELTVLQVAAAAERVLLRRGYVVVGRTASEHHARIIGRYAGQFPHEDLEINASTDQDGIGLAISPKPLGDSAEAQAVLEDVLILLAR